MNPDHTSNEPMRPRLSATVILTRPQETKAGEPSGFEVCMVQRSPTQRVLPGFFAFPGGAVDPVDWTVAQAWVAEGKVHVPKPFNTDPVFEVDQSDGANVGEQPLEMVYSALLCAAVREALEETGVGLFFQSEDHERSGSPLRTALLDGQWEDFERFAKSTGPRSLQYFGRRVTPTEVRFRFDAHYFVAVIERETPISLAIGELERFLWATPEEILVQGDGIRLALPTQDAIRALGEYGSLETLLESGQMPAQRYNREEVQDFFRRFGLQR